MATFNYDVTSTTANLTRIGLDRYAPDSSFGSALKPRLVASNEREHALALRLNKIEHNILENRKQEHLDRDALKQDFNATASVLDTVIDFDNHTEHMLHNIAAQVKAVDHEREKEMTLILSAVNENSVAIDNIIKDVQVLDNTQRAELILEQITDVARSTAKAAEIAADGVGVVPVFGPSIANGAKVVANGAELVANTADAIKASGILRELDTVFKAVNTVHERPANLVAASVEATNTATELVGKLKVLMDAAKRRNDAGFAKLTNKDTVRMSTFEYPDQQNEYFTHVVYNLHPTNGALGMQVEVRENVIKYDLRKQYGELDVNKFGTSVMQSGAIAGIQRSKTTDQFPLKSSISHCLALVQALSELSGQMDGVSIASYLEQYFVLNLLPDKRPIVNLMNKKLHDLQFSPAGINWHLYETELIASMAAAKPLYRAEVEAKFPGAGMKLVPDKFTSLEATPHLIDLDTQHRIADYGIYEYMVGPFTHSGTYRVNVIVDQLGYDTWYMQVMGVKGQVVSANVTDGAPLTTALSFSVSSRGFIDNEQGCDRKMIRIYSKGCKNVRISAGWGPTPAKARIPPKTLEEHVNNPMNYSVFKRHLDPTRTITTGNRLWTDYTSPGNWNTLT